MARVTEEDKKVLRICRIGESFTSFHILRKMNWPALHKLAYRLTKLTGMGLLTRVNRGSYRLTTNGKSYCKGKR